MSNIDLNPRTITNLFNGKLNWVVKPATQVYTYEKINGNLAEEMSIITANDSIKADPIPSIDPDDFEADYKWFYS